MDRLRTNWVVGLWMVILSVISIRTVLAKNTNTVYPIFSDAGRKWLVSENLYSHPRDGLDQFRYCPAVAIGFVPLGLMSDPPGEVVWRWLNGVAFLGALAVWWREWRGGRAGLAALMLLVIPLTIASLNNGQCNAMLTGLMLLAAVAFARNYAWTAAACVTGAALLKCYPLALGLLFCVAEPRRFTPRLAICVLAGLALPYLFQRPDYVTAQYAGFVERLGNDDRTHWPLHAGYKDLHLIVRAAGWPLSLQGYRLIEVLAGVACAAVVLAGRLRGWRPERLADVCLSLGALWMTLFGPATESSTYILLAPVLGRAILDAAERHWPQRLLAYSSFALFIVSACIVWFPRSVFMPVQAMGIQPMAAIPLLIFVLVDAKRNQPEASARAGDAPHGHSGLVAA